MTDRNENDGEKKEPPKIKLGLDKELTDPAETTLSPSDDTPKSGTIRIDLSAAEPPPKSGTTRIDVSQAVPGQPKRDTTRIDPSQAEPPPIKRSTTRIDVSAAQPPAESPPIGGKSETSRLDLSQAIPPPAAAQPASEPADTESDLQETIIPAAAKQSTQRIIVDDDDTSSPGDSGLKTVAQVQAAKQQTSRIDLPSSVEEKDEDVLKRRTAPLSLGAQPSAMPPTTIKKKPEAPPTTQIRPRPTVEADTAPQSRTVQLDLPPDTSAPKSGAPKTIRIKRPDGTSSRKPLTIARAGSATGTAAEAEPTLAATSAAFLEEDEGPGATFAVLTILSVLVTVAVIYALLGQTYALDLPFWGRL